MCIILSAGKTISETEDPTLVDKAAILCSLNIKSMTFDDSIGLLIKNKKVPSELIFYDEVITQWDSVLNLGGLGSRC